VSQSMPRSLMFGSYKAGTTVNTYGLAIISSSCLTHVGDARKHYDVVYLDYVVLQSHN